MPLAQQPIASPFNAKSLASEVIEGVDLRGKTAIVTGGSSGLGVETARALLTAGASLILPSRSRAKAEKVAVELRAATGNQAVEVADMDLGDFASVRAFAKSFASAGRPLHLLINNAGLMMSTRQTVEGDIEAQFGCNHLGHMLLACLLTPALIKGAPSRVVALSSGGHRFSPMMFDDINFDRRPYDMYAGYGQSKTANALFAVEYNRRHEAQGVMAFAAHPGMIATELGRDVPKEITESAGAQIAMTAVPFKTTDGGAATAVWCATSPLLNLGGVYCENCNVAEIIPGEFSKVRVGVNPWAIDADAAQQLWTLSEEMLGERFA